jgi:phosphatidylserine/phosphatidylglycerophosphate/cardiolipin synthase-like enzyme
VRILTDKRSAERYKDYFAEFSAAGIPVVTNNRASYLMHNKYAILDQKTVWTGSWNYTDGATYGNNENAIALDTPGVARYYQLNFDYLYDKYKRELGRAANDPTSPAMLEHGVQILFSPINQSLSIIADLINNARRTIAVMAFSFTNKELANALIVAARRGVVVRSLFEKSLARNTSVVGSLCVVNSSVQVRLDSNPRNLHHDVIVVDDEQVITGSANFSQHSFTDNDENMIIIPDAILARRYLAEFARLWATATVPDSSLCATNPE